MRNIEIAWAFQLIAELLELSEDNPFKVRAYRKGAHVMANLPVDVAELRNEGKLNEIPGIGKNLAAKIEEYIGTGQIKYLTELKNNVPEGLREIMAIPGLGAKKIRAIYQNLGVASLESLEQAAKGKQIRELPGMGNKTEQAILRGIEMLRTRVARVPLYIAAEVARELVGFLQKVPGVAHAEVAGSIRRWKETAGDIDLVVAAKNPEIIIDLFTRHPKVKEVLMSGDTKASVILYLGIQADLRVVELHQFWTVWHELTGSKEHNVALRERAKKKGLKIKSLPVQSEEDIYRYLELPYIPPELREDSGEIEAADKGMLPDIFTVQSIKGDLHLHSDWSDGVNAIPEMAAKARELGYEYVAITDHTKSLGVARGLPLAKLREQEEYIRELNKSLDGITILHGMEVEILADGNLDHPDEVLAGMDVVIASVHSGFRQDEARLTGRILKALDNRYVNIIAHPTGRLIGRRDPYAVNVEEVIERAAKNNKILEINASPDRLDLKDTHARKAKEKGVKIAINTDAHDQVHMTDMVYGVAVARRAWLEEPDVINTSDLASLKKHLEKSR